MFDGSGKSTGFSPFGQFPLAMTLYDIHIQLIARRVNSWNNLSANWRWPEPEFSGCGVAEGNFFRNRGDGAADSHRHDLFLRTWMEFVCARQCQ